MNQPYPISKTQSNALTGISELAIVIGLTMFLPFIVHMIPSWDDSPIGGKFLPMFYAPLLAALTRKWHISVIASIVSPWLNHFIFGAPNLSLALILSVQLVPFCYLAYFAGKRFGAKFWIGPAAYIIGKPLVLPLFWIAPQLMPPNAMNFMINTTLNAIPGIIILGLISYLSTRIFPPHASA